MKRRKLAIGDAPHQQFQCLKQIPSLSNSDCRQVIDLLRHDGKGKTTCWHANVSHRTSNPLLRHLELPSTVGSVEKIWHMDFVRLVQAKVDSCPFFNESLSRAARQHGGHLRLVYYTDEVVCGIALNAQLQRKSALVYVTFLELPLLCFESVWLTLSVCRHDEINTFLHGHHGMTKSLLSLLRKDTENGFPITLSGNHELLFIRDILILGDHEELRAMTGSKGAMALKPCMKCINVVALNRPHADGHINIGEANISLCELQSTEGLDTVFSILEMQPTQKKKEEHEFLLGWYREPLRESFLMDRSLRGFAQIESVHYDAMHDYWSNGFVGQELGLWFTAISRKTQVQLHHICVYAETGWMPVPGTFHEHRSMKSLFSSKVFRIDSDYRGNASATASIVGLCVAFSEEMLRETERNVHAEFDSLLALHRVCKKIFAMKADASIPPSELQRLQVYHLNRFDIAYDVSLSRPKRHFALHLPQQRQQWGRLIDAFVCERKHRHFRSSGVSNIARLTNFSKSALLKLVDGELNTPQDAAKLDGLLAPPIKQSPTLALSFPGQNVTCAAKLEAGGQTFVQHQILQTGATRALKIVCCIQADLTFYILARELELRPGTDPSDPILHWLEKHAGGVCVPIKDLKIIDRPQFYRCNDDGSFSVI